MSPDQTHVRYGAYHRISRLNGRDLDDESTMSDKDAFEQIDAWAKLRGATIVDRYPDTDVSGSTLSRPELDRMLDDLRAERINGIVVAQVDRLSRADVGDALAVVRQIFDLTPNLALLDLGIDPATEFGEFGLTVLLALARMQWRRYKRQWSSAQTRALDRGAWIGAVPLGYRRIVIAHRKNGKPIHGPLEPAEAAPIVREAFNIAARDGIHAAVKHLQRAAPTRTRRVKDADVLVTMHWTTDSTRKLLSSRVYIGENRGKRTHEPLTTLADFEAAQFEPGVRRQNGAYPLSGVASCAQCGAPLAGQLQTVADRTYRRYRCSNRACGGGSSISADKLERHVRDHLKQRLGDAIFRVRFVPGEIEEAQFALQKAEDERIRYARDLDFRDRIGDAGWRAGADEHTARVEKAQQRLREIAAQSARSRTLPAADELDDDEQLLRAIRATTGSIRVHRAPKGARVPIGDRVEINLDDGVGEAAA